MAIGVDLTEVARIERWFEAYEAGTLAAVFTPREQAAAARCGPWAGRLLSVCFATKEAVGKALGTGLAGIAWTDIEADVTRAGLTVSLTGSAAALAQARGINRWHASWASTRRVVIVSVAGDAADGHSKE